MFERDLTRLTLLDAASLVRSREVSPVELTRACLERIARLDSYLNAFILVMEEQALDAARHAEAQILRGEWRGPLHGIPIGLKDLIDVSGVPTTAGSLILADVAAAEDSEVTRRLTAAGAIVLGKLNLHEFAYGATGVNPHYGAVANPWDIQRIAGGSSSGSAAAVSAGLCFASIGTDTGGSIRIPASLCGITGLKPTFGRVSSRGIVPLSSSLDHVGPLARTVPDAAAVLQVIAGHDSLDDSSPGEPVPDFGAGLRDIDLSGVRVGVPDSFFFEEIDPEVQDAVSGAISRLEELGAPIVEVSLPHISELRGAVATIQAPEALAYHHRWLSERRNDYGEDVRRRLDAGSGYSALQYVQAQRLREMAAREWREKVFTQVEVIATPTTAIPAPLIREAELSATLALIRLTNPFNLLGVPAISVPCGFTEAGLPIGLQLAASWWREAEVLRVAGAFENGAPWRNTTPSLDALDER